MSLLAFLPIIGQVLDRVLPDKAASEAAKLKVLELTQSGQLAHLDADVKLAAGQLEINKVEAANPSLFVSGWRPAVGWVCVFAIAYQLILRPLGFWGAAIFMDVAPPLPPEIELTDILMLLGGLLGLGTLRTVEKIHGVASK